MKASGVAVRLVLLALLLGLGVLHTLSHAGAHGGVSAPTTVSHSHEAHGAATAVEETGASHAPSAAHASVEQQDPQHRAHAEGATAADCFALIPGGSWLAPPPCTAVSSGATGFGVFAAGAVQDPGGGPALAQLSVLRI
ncbi:hypothetical protein StrepF001_38740 [Streptomyces sp. F001]|nr:hypothetical protein StrepF001_38740 [Streptomyces sp. F001]